MPSTPRWLAELTATLDVGRIVRALRLSSRPPKAGAPLPPEVATRLTDGAGEALTADAAPERWVAVLDALAFAPVRDKVIPASLPKDLHADVQATIARLATRIPKIAHIFEITPDRNAPRPKVERRRPSEAEEARRRQARAAAQARRAEVRATAPIDEPTSAETAAAQPAVDAPAVAEEPTVAEPAATEEPVAAAPSRGRRRRGDARRGSARRAAGGARPSPVDAPEPRPPTRGADGDAPAEEARGRARSLLRRETPAE